MWASQSSPGVIGASIISRQHHVHRVPSRLMRASTITRRFLVPTRLATFHPFYWGRLSGQTANHRHDFRRCTAQRTTRCSSFLILFVSGNSGGHHMPEFYYPVALLAVLPIHSPVRSPIHDPSFRSTLNSSGVASSGLWMVPLGAVRSALHLQLSSAPPGRSKYYSTPPDEEVNPFGRNSFGYFTTNSALVHVGFGFTVSSYTTLPRSSRTS